MFGYLQRSGWTQRDVQEVLTWESTIDKGFASVSRLWEDDNFKSWNSSRIDCLRTDGGD